MFTLPDLPYGYASLEPFIDEGTMRIHHDKHHAAYINNLNDALKDSPDWLTKDVNEILTSLDKVPEAIRTKVKNNAGGHANHTLFWEMMTPNKEGSNEQPPKLRNKVLDAINAEFGSFDAFKEKFSAVALGHFGSGWAWLTVKAGKLEISDTSNQDSLVTDGKQPVLALDVWEHAYYLKYKNMRADYIKAWWNVVSWKRVNELFEKGVSTK
jgi:Fe-Mn family superoxide dismutase